MGGRQEEAALHQENSVLVIKELEAAREEVARVVGEKEAAAARVEELEEEVEKLRVGLHEILDSVKDQDGRSDVQVTPSSSTSPSSFHFSSSSSPTLPLLQVTSSTLESLLVILDARHYYGEYTPNIGLKAAMDRLEGTNTQLR